MTRSISTNKIVWARKDGVLFITLPRAKFQAGDVVKITLLNREEDEEA